MLEPVLQEHWNCLTIYCKLHTAADVVAELLNRTFVEMARYMLLDAKIDYRFWAEVVNTARGTFAEHAAISIGREDSS